MENDSRLENKQQGIMSQKVFVFPENVWQILTFPICWKTRLSDLFATVAEAV